MGCVHLAHGPPLLCREWSAFFFYVGARCSLLCRRLLRVHTCNFFHGRGPLQFNLPSLLPLDIVQFVWNWLRPAAVESAVAFNLFTFFLQQRGGPAAVKSAVAFTIGFHGVPAPQQPGYPVFQDCTWWFLGSAFLWVDFSPDFVANYHLACFPWFLSTWCSICYVFTIQASVRRRLRRARAVARHKWWLYRTGRIEHRLHVPVLSWILRTLSGHHSKDIKHLSTVQRHLQAEWHTQNPSRGVVGLARGLSRPNNSFVQIVDHGEKTSTISPTSLLHKDRQRITVGHGTHGKTAPRDGPRLLPGDSPGAHQPGAREKDQRRAKRKGRKKARRKGRTREPKWSHPSPTLWCRHCLPRRLSLPCRIQRCLLWWKRRVVDPNPSLVQNLLRQSRKPFRTPRRSLPRSRKRWTKRRLLSPKTSIGRHQHWAGPRNRSENWKRPKRSIEHNGWRTWRMHCNLGNNRCSRTRINNNPSRMPLSRQRRIWTSLIGPSKSWMQRQLGSNPQRLLRENRKSWAHRKGTKIQKKRISGSRYTKRWLSVPWRSARKSTSQNFRKRWMPRATKKKNVVWTPNDCALHHLPNWMATPTERDQW